MVDHQALNRPWQIRQTGSMSSGVTRNSESLQITYLNRAIPHQLGVPGPLLCPTPSYNIYLAAHQACRPTGPPDSQAAMQSALVDHFVGKLSATGQPTRPTQPSFPPGSVNVITWLMAIETIKRQSNHGLCP